MLAAGAALTAALPAAATTYLPVGPQNDVAYNTVINGGWTLCFSEAYGQGGTLLAGALTNCTGSKLMMAGIENGSDTIKLLAQAGKTDVLFDTGDANNVTHTANGTNWYFSTNWSWGFAPAGDAVLRETCDASGVFNDDISGFNQRLCWHTGDNALSGGWRLGDVYWLNDEPTGYTRLLFTSSAIPEPASWVLLIAGFALVGTAQRSATRRRKVARAA